MNPETRKYLAKIGAKGGKKRIKMPAAIQDEEKAQAFHDDFLKRNRVSVGYHVLQDEWKEYLLWSKSMAQHAPATYVDLDHFGKILTKYFGQEYVENIGQEHFQTY